MTQNKKENEPQCSVRMENQALVKAMSCLVTLLLGSWAGLRAAEECDEEQKIKHYSGEDFGQTTLISFHYQQDSLLYSHTS